MAGRGGKGKVSNSLVAASCAAVLAVYAAGYWRTREAERRFESQAQERKPARPEVPTAAGLKTGGIETTAPPALSSPQPPPTISSPMVSAPSATAAAAKALPKAAAPEPQPAVASPQPTLPPVIESAAVAESVTSVDEPDAVSLPMSESPPAPGGNWRDGTYTGWGTSRHGDIKAQVVIRNGRIVESSIASCETRWPCDVISAIFNQPVERQNADVDRVSRATESANAYYYALVAALDDALVQTSDQTTTVR